MATSTQLPNIAKFADRIGGLGAKQRGMRIEANDWNTLIDVIKGVLEIERAQEDTTQSSLDQRFAPRNHEHLGHVTTAWLDPALQASFAQSVSGPTRVALADLQQKVDSLRSEVARLTTHIAAQQQVIDRFAVNDVDRAKVLSGFETRFAGIENLRTQVTGLSAQFDGFRANVNTVLDLKKSLSDAAGARIDVAKLRQDVTDLGALRENLKGADGNLLRLRDVELNLKELSDAVGVAGPGALEARIAKTAGEVEARLNQRVDDRTNAVRQDVLAAQAASAAKVEADSKATVAAALANVEPTLTAKVAEAETRLTTKLKGDIAASVKTARDDITAATATLLDQRLATVSDHIKTAVTAARTDLATSLRTELSAQLSANVQAQVGGVETRLTARANDADARQTTFQTQFRADMQRSVADQIAAAKTELGGKLDAQVTQTHQALSAEVATRVADAMTAAAPGIDAKIAAGVTAQIGNLDGRVSQAVTAALHTLPDQITSAVKLVVAALDVAGQLQKASDRLTTQFRSEMNQAITDQQVRSTAAVNAAVAQLRGETAAAVQAGSDGAFQRASDAIAGARSDLKQLSDKVTSEVRRLDAKIAAR
jgi:hypothetical protein